MKKLAFLSLLVLACATTNNDLTPNNDITPPPEIQTVTTPDFQQYLHNVIHHNQPAPKIAILPEREYLSDDEKIADMMIAEFLRVGWTVVARDQLQRILSEQSLTLSGILEPEARVSIGRLLGIKMFVLCRDEYDSFKFYGDYPYGKYITFRRGTIKIIDIETGSIVATTNYRWAESWEQAGPSHIVHDLITPEALR